jgi:RNA polymerase sigma-70 factor (sigma-E family)
VHLDIVTFDEYVAARLPALLRYAVMLTGDPHLAEDVVQDAMVRVHGHWDRIQRAEAPDAYVRRMVTNTYLGWRRSGWFRRSVAMAQVPDAVVGDSADARAARDELWSRLAQLSSRQRAALVLRYYEDLPDAEIAEVMGCAVGTVRSLISRALSALRADSRLSHATSGGLK